MDNMRDCPYKHPEIATWSEYLVTSFYHWTQQTLVPPQPFNSLAQSLFAAPYAVVSHGTQADPIFNYANRCALTLWEMDWTPFTQLPSRLSAEPLHREERAQMLAQLNSQGFVDNYRGIRISSQGRRFYIEQAMIWNVLDTAGERVGQAATFHKWTYLGP